jgi:hypothetical protein
MKEQLIFNHDANTLTEALGITSEEMARITHDIVTNYASNPAYTSVSHMSQLIHERIPHAMLVFMATQQIHSMMHDFEKMVDATKDLLKGFNEDED